MLTRHQTIVKLATLIVLLILTGQARADFIAFGSRDAFRTAIANTLSTTEGWDEFASGTIIPNGTLVNGVAYHLSDPSANFVVTPGGATVSFPNGLGRTNNPFGGEAFIPADIITFTFPMLISAFGISFNTASTGNGAYILTTNLGDVALSAYDPFPGFGTGQFAGFISSEPISSTTIQTLVSFQFGLDDMIFVQAVPEPTSLTLLAVGVLCLTGSCVVRSSRKAGRRWRSRSSITPHVRSISRKPERRVAAGLSPNL
jgi:hypothetical protein